MSKNLASGLPEPDALIVLSAVLPDWECKSAAFFFTPQVQDKSILKLFLIIFAIRSKWVKYAPIFLQTFFVKVLSVHQVCRIGPWSAPNPQLEYSRGFTLICVIQCICCQNCSIFTQAAWNTRSRASSIVLPVCQYRLAEGHGSEYNVASRLCPYVHIDSKRTSLILYICQYAFNCFQIFFKIKAGGRHKHNFLHRGFF